MLDMVGLILYAMGGIFFRVVFFNDFSKNSRNIFI
jgi:hypothetical protein